MSLLGATVSTQAVRLYHRRKVKTAGDEELKEIMEDTKDYQKEFFDDIADEGQWNAIIDRHKPPYPNKDFWEIMKNPGDAITESIGQPYNYWKNVGYAEGIEDLKEDGRI